MSRLMSYAYVNVLSFSLLITSSICHSLNKLMVPYQTYVIGWANVAARDG